MFRNVARWKQKKVKQLMKTGGEKNTRSKPMDLD